MRSFARKMSLTIVGVCLSAPAARAADADITPALPEIPAAKFTLTDFGAVGDGKTMNTDAFKLAVAAVKAAGGGHLIVPAGIYKTLGFTLTSHLDLHLDAGAVIKAPDKLADWGIADPNHFAGSATSKPTTSSASSSRERTRPGPFISSPKDSTDIAITGSGTIDGSGQIFWIWSDKAARNYPPGRTIIPRPYLVSLTGKRIHVDGITLTNSPMFHLVPRGEDILIENVRIVAPSDAPNTDAIDPGGDRIVIRHCEIDSGDDNVAVQSGSHDVLIEDLTCLHGHGISIGSSTKNGLSHVIVRRCTFDGTDNGLRIKSYRGMGGEVKDIQYSDITMKNVKRPFDINMRYNGNANSTSDVGPLNAEPDQTEFIPNFHDIHVTNLTVTRCPVAGRIIGLPEQQANNITFTNVSIQSDRGFLVQDAKDIKFEKATITPAIGEPFVLDRATVNVNGKTITGPAGGSPTPFF